MRVLLLLLTVFALASCGTRTPTRDQRFVDTSTVGGGGGGPGPSNCEAVCTMGACVGGKCVITPAADAQAIRCPDGVPCEVDCRQAASCAGDITCGDGGCDIVCTGNTSCAGAITCGTGSCNITCGTDGTTQNTCAGAIDCTNASSCEVACPGDRACGSTITCGAGPCDVTCGGEGGVLSCFGRIFCFDSCACNVTCAPNNCGGSTCPEGCRVPGDTRQCTAGASGCDTCGG